MFALGRSNGHCEPVLRRLIQAGADLDLRGTDGRTACLMALFDDNYAELRLLLELGADPDVADQDGNTVLMWALRKRDSVRRRDSADLESILDALRKSGADAQGAVQVELLDAVEAGDLDAARRCLSRGADLNHRLGTTPLCVAARQGDPAMVQWLLDHGADIDRRISEPTRPDDPKSEQDWNPLLWACAEGHLDVVRLLVDRGADLEVGFRAMGSVLDMARSSTEDRYERSGDPAAVVDYLESIGVRSFL